MTDLMFQDPKGLVNRAAFNARFSVLNELYRYWWKRIGVNGSIIKSDITAPVIIGDKSAGVSISYGTDLKIKSDGSAEIVDPIEYKTTWISSDGAQEAAETLASFAPCYLRGLTGDTGNIYYLPNGTTYGKEFDPPLQTISYQTSNVSLQVDGVSVKAQKVSVSTEISDWEYVFSDSRNAYPDSGEQNGYEYQYLGIPFENAREAPKILIGGYTGTGTYGKNAPNRLTFEGVPILLAISSLGSYSDLETARGNAGAQDIQLWYMEHTWGREDFSLGKADHAKWIGGNTLEWYSTKGALEQYNYGYGYIYVALVIGGSSDINPVILEGGNENVSITSSTVIYFKKGDTATVELTNKSNWSKQGTDKYTVTLSGVDGLTASKMSTSGTVGTFTITAIKEIYGGTCKITWQ